MLRAIFAGITLVLVNDGLNTIITSSFAKWVQDRNPAKELDRFQKGSITSVWMGFDTVVTSLVLLYQPYMVIPTYLMNVVRTGYKESQRLRNDPNFLEDLHNASTKRKTTTLDHPVDRKEVPSAPSTAPRIWKGNKTKSE